MLSSRKNLLKEALSYLKLALEAHREAVRNQRLQALWKRLLRPGAFVLALFSISLLTVFFFAIGIRGTLCFTLGVLCYMVPLLSWIWRANVPKTWQPFWAEVHRSDEVMAQLADRELLLWPGFHPEELWEEGASASEILQGVYDRQEQLNNAIKLIDTEPAGEENQTPATEP